MYRTRYILVLFLGFCFSQEDDFNMDATYVATFGSVTMNNKIYNQISFTPEIPIGKNMGLGLEFYLYFDENGELYGENWDFSSSEASFKTIVDKIKYFRYGQPFDNLYFRIGSIPSATMGFGILAKGYSNNIDYPQSRRVGFDFRYSFSDFRLEFIHSDFKEFSSPSLFGFRTVIPLANKLSLGITAATDLDQINGLVDTDNDDFPDYVDYDPNNDNIWSAYQDSIAIVEELFNCPNSDECQESDVQAILDQLEEAFNNEQLQNDFLENDNISGLGIDLAYQINDRWTVYTELAQLIGETVNPYDESISPELYADFDTNLGFGFIPFGMIGRLGPNYEVTFGMDIRQSSEKFVFHYWDQNYDHNRAMISGDKYITKESQLYNYGKLKGLNISLLAQIKFFLFGTHYMYMVGDRWDSEVDDYVESKNNSFYMKFGIDTSMIPKVRVAELFYQQLNTPNPFDFKKDENTLFGLNIGIDVADNMALIFKARETYIKNDNGKYEAVRSTQIETSVYF